MHIEYQLHRMHFALFNDYGHIRPCSENVYMLIAIATLTFSCLHGVTYYILPKYLPIMLALCLMLWIAYYTRIMPDA